MRSFFALRSADLVAQRPAAGVEDVHFPEALVSAVLAEYSAVGDLVLDPFAGYGTTLVVAARLGRRAVGVELLASQLAIIRSRPIGTARLLHADARDLAQLLDEPIDLCLTSPPYMSVVDPENPLTGYETLDGDYSVYLHDLDQIFGQVADALRPGGHLVVNVANIVSGQTVTPLAWDVARLISARLSFRQECFLCWDHQPSWMSGDYCFVFEKLAQPIR